MDKINKAAFKAHIAAKKEKLQNYATKTTDSGSISLEYSLNGFFVVQDKDNMLITRSMRVAVKAYNTNNLDF